MFWLIFLLFTFPLWALVWQGAGFQIPPIGQWWPAFTFTFIQALLSSLVSVSLGFLGALGLLGLRKWRRPTEALLLLPSLVPTLLVLVGVLQSISWVSPFPFGLWGVVLVHAILNVGLISVSVARLIEARLAPLETLALIEGASFFLFLKAGFKLLQPDLLRLALFVFSACVSSFAVVLVASGGLEHTIEVLIFYKLKQNLLNEALALGFLQMLLLACVALCLSNYQWAGPNKKALHLLYKPWLLCVPLLSTLCVGMGLLGPGIYKGVWQILQQPYLRQSLFEAGVHSFIIGLGTGVGVVLLFVILMLLLYDNQVAWVRKFLLAYSMPSTVLMGFGFLLLFDESILLTAMGLVLLFFPFVYRLSGDASLMQLNRDLQVARLMGASRGQVVGQILAPQMSQSICFCAGLAAFWAVGDFAFSSVVLSEPKTLALITYDLLRSYHLNMALVMVWLLCAVALLLWFLFLGSAYVYKKLLFTVR